MFTAIFWLLVMGLVFAAIVSFAYDMYLWSERMERDRKNPPPRQIPPDDIIGSDVKV